MFQLTADDTTRDKLTQASELAEIRDSSERVVGYFVPVGVRKARVLAEAPDQVDSVEIVRGRAKHQVGYTTRQVFEYLKTRTTDPRDLADLQEQIDRRRAEEDSETLQRDPPPDADPHIEVDQSS